MTTTYSTHDEAFFDREDLEEELTRVYDICHGCRLCFSLCPSFPALFDAVDAHDDAGEGEVDALTSEEREKVVDECYQCKLCYVRCPYTPDDGHPFNLDFPRLMLRAQAVRARETGVSMKDRMMGNPDRLGRLMSATAPISNFMNRRKTVRWVMEKTSGISRRFDLPPYYRQTFRKWWDKRGNGAAETSDAEDKVALFTTCTVNFSRPEVGRAAVEALEASGVDVSVPPQECCGMPYLDVGAVDLATARMRRNVDALLPAVREGRKIVVPGPTCSYVLKKEAPEIVGTDAARLVGESTMDLCEYLVGLSREGKLFAGGGEARVPHGMGKVAYHVPCHLRAQNVGQPARQLLSRLPDTELHVIEQCSGVDGTWGMQAEHFDAGRHVARKLLKGLNDAAADHVVTDCPLAGLRIQQETGQAPLHPVELLVKAYPKEAP